MRSRTLLLGLLLGASPMLAANLRQVEDEPMIIIGTVLTHSNTRNKAKGVPDRWLIDVSNDGGSDFELYDLKERTLSELVTAGTVIEAEVKRVEGKHDEEYILQRWIRVGGPWLQNHR